MQKLIVIREVLILDRTCANMEPLTDFRVPANVAALRDGEVEDFKHVMNEMSSQVNKLKQKVQEIEQFFSRSCKKRHMNSRNNSVSRDKDEGRHTTSILPQQNCVASSKRIRTILNQDKRKEEEEANEQACRAEMAKEVSSELYEVEVYLKELREVVLQKCRKMSTLEKRQLGRALMQLSPEDLGKALEIVAQCNPTFQATAEVVNLELDAQSETTLWRLKYFVSKVWEAPANLPANGVEGDDNIKNDVPNPKRKRGVASNVPSKRPKKKAKKINSNV